MNEYLNWTRLGLLIRNDFIENSRNYLVIFLVFAIIFLLQGISSAGFGFVNEFHYYGWFNGMIFIGGTIFASLGFAELQDKKFNEAFLLMPASTTEKVISRYLASSVFYIVHVLIFMTVISLIIEGINMMLFGRSNGLFNPFHPSVWYTIGYFLVIHPIFFLGGAWFKRIRWFKTVITLFIIGFLHGILSTVTFLVLFAGTYQEMPMVFNNVDFSFNWERNMTIFNGVGIGLKILFFFIIPVFCLVVTWLRVKETQVSDGI